VSLIPRYLKSWKPWFYDLALPSLLRLGPERADTRLRAIGRSLALWPPRRRRIRHGLEHARRALSVDWPQTELERQLAENLARFAARDLSLSGLSDIEALDRFEVVGAENLKNMMRRDRGAILLGCHFGAYLPAMHWLMRYQVQSRLMVQRPRHVSRELLDWFDQTSLCEIPPQSAFFLRRSMPATEGIARVLQVRSALKAGLAIYINGDVPWNTACARSGRFLGSTRGFLSVWADLAIATGAPVLPIFAAHRNGGRFAVTIDPPWFASKSDDPIDLLDRYLRRLEAAIAAEPADAIPHLLWPSYATGPFKPRMDSARAFHRREHRSRIENSNTSMFENI